LAIGNLIRYRFDSPFVIRHSSPHEPLRKSPAIDKLDAKIVRLLNDRNPPVLAIGEIKLAAGEENLRAHRERASSERLRQTPAHHQRHSAVLYAQIMYTLPRKRQ